MPWTEDRCQTPEHLAPGLCHMNRCFPAGAVRHGAVFGMDKVRLQCGRFCAGGGKE